MFVSKVLHILISLIDIKNKKYINFTQNAIMSLPDKKSF